MSSQPSQEQQSLFPSTPDKSGMQVWLPDKTGQLPGVSWTHSTSESPNDGAECSRVYLSDILTQVPPDARYWLSPKACAGILRRATRRGKKLPEPLQKALEARAAS
jgi:hypothetical protein